MFLLCDAITKGRRDAIGPIYDHWGRFGRCRVLQSDLIRRSPAARVYLEVTGEAKRFNRPGDRGPSFWPAARRPS